MKQKHLFWGAAVALTFLFSASAIAQPRHTKKKVKKVVEAKVGRMSVYRQMGRRRD